MITWRTPPSLSHNQGKEDSELMQLPSSQQLRPLRITINGIETGTAYQIRELVSASEPSD